MFDIATRKKFRYNSEIGLLTTEDLWGLKLTQLDVIAKTLSKQIKEAEEESFISKPTTANKEATDKLDIVIHVIKVLIEEEESRKDAKKKREEKSLLTDLLHKKNMEELESMSKDDLLKKLASLEG